MHSYNPVSTLGVPLCWKEDFCQSMMVENYKSNFTLSISKHVWIFELQIEGSIQAALTDYPWATGSFRLFEWFWSFGLLCVCPVNSRPTNLKNICVCASKQILLQTTQSFLCSDIKFVLIDWNCGWSTMFKTKHFVDFLAHILHSSFLLPMYLNRKNVSNFVFCRLGITNSAIKSLWSAKK